MPHSASTLANLIQRVTRLNRLISQQTGRTRPGQIFTQLQHETLSFLESHHQARVGALAMHLGISLPSTAQLLGRLERSGWVARAMGKHDRRSVTVAVTARGHAHLKVLDAGRDKRFSKLFKGVTVSQLRTMAEVMRTMYRNASNQNNVPE